MPDYPIGDIPRDIVGVFAGYFANGRGPTHSNIASAVLSAGVLESELVYSNKEDRIRGAFRSARGDESFALVEELLDLLRNDDAFGRMPSSVAWAKRARAAFRRAGWSIDEDGYAEWHTAGLTANDPEGLLPFVRPRGVIAAETVRIAEAARSARARETVAERTLGRQAPPPGIAVPPRRYSAGDAIPNGLTRADKMKPKIFLVHGHDEASRNAVESFVHRTTGITPTVLMLEASGGLTVIEKFEKHADTSAYAIVLMTADDVGQANAEAEAKALPKARARQNVVFEFGYFVGYLTRSHVAALVAPGVEHPSDLSGVVYIPFMASSSDWKEVLRREMRNADIPILD